MKTILNPFSARWWGDCPGPWLSLLVPAVVLALGLSWACGAFGETVSLIPADLPAAEYLLRKHDIFGQVIEGELVKTGDTQVLVCRVMVAAGNVQTVKVVLVGEGK